MLLIILLVFWRIVNHCVNFLKQVVLGSWIGCNLNVNRILKASKIYTLPFPTCISLSINTSAKPQRKSITSGKPSTSTYPSKISSAKPFNNPSVNSSFKFLQLVILSSNPKICFLSFLLQINANLSMLINKVVSRGWISLNSRKMNLLLILPRLVLKSWNRWVLILKKMPS